MKDNPVYIEGFNDGAENAVAILESLGELLVFDVQLTKSQVNQLRAWVENAAKNLRKKVAR